MPPDAPVPTAAGLYEADPHAWAFAQADLLRAGRLDALDRANLIEELESLGRQQRAELVNRLVVLIAHLLKWRLQPDRRSRSWALTIAEQRLAIRDHLADNPSLAPVRSTAVDKAYARARIAAAAETGLPLRAVPLDCPFGWDEIAAAPLDGDPDEPEA